MALKYFIEYKDVINITHRVELFDDNFTGTALQIGGRAYLPHGEVDRTLEAIRGQGLRLEIEANTELTFNDLWTEEEKVISVLYIRDSITLFNGWLNPEGFFEDYVSTDWIITLDCVDGLSYLKDLSFVDDAGFPITGRKKYIEILAIALKRTGLNLNINTDIQIRYNGLSDTLDPLDNVYANTARYIKEDNDTITDCETVIRDILEPFSACLTLYNNEWHIFKPNQLFSDQTASFYTYDFDANPIGSKTLDTFISIGGESLGFYPHHCNANQQITNKSSLGAYRVNYKYGLVQGLLQNPDLFSSDGITIDNWQFYTPNNIEPLIAGESGIILNNNFFTVQKEIRTSQLITVLEGFKLTTTIKFSALKSTSGTIVFGIGLSDNSDFDANPLYYLDFQTNNWENWSDLASSDPLFEPFTPPTVVFTLPFNIPNVGQDFTVNIEHPIIPSGFASLNVFIFINSWAAGTPTIPTGPDIKINSVNISPNPPQQESGLLGEFHTLERLNKPSAKVDEVKEVLTGDNPSDFYEGTIYKNDTITPTDFWSRKGKGESKELLRIMVEDVARMQQATAREFSGDVFGYFPYLSTISINGLNGLFMPIKYEYDTKENITKCTFRQIFADELLDIEYKKTFDFGNTVKPTIKG